MSTPTDPAPHTISRRPIGVLAAMGTFVVFVALFLPWYQGHAPTRTGWSADLYLVILVLAMTTIGGVLAASLLTSHQIPRNAAIASTAFGFIVTITAVARLFINRPGVDSLTAPAVGGYLALAGINTIKGVAILLLVTGHRVLASPH